jgi:hypothetical protein
MSELEIRDMRKSHYLETYLAKRYQNPWESSKSKVFPSLFFTICPVQQGRTFHYICRIGYSHEEANGSGDGAAAAGAGAGVASAATARVGVASAAATGA